MRKFCPEKLSKVNSFCDTYFFRMKKNKRYETVVVFQFGFCDWMLKPSGWFYLADSLSRSIWTPSSTRVTASAWTSRTITPTHIVSPPEADTSSPTATSSWSCRWPSTRASRFTPSRSKLLRTKVWKHILHSFRLKTLGTWPFPLALTWDRNIADEAVTQCLAGEALPAEGENGLPKANLG